MKKAVVCMVPTESQADTIVSQLHDAGFPPDDVTVVFPDKRGSRALRYERATKAPEGGLVGGIVGAIVGLTVGFIVNAATAVETAAVGAVAGAVLGALVGALIPEIELKLFARGDASNDLLIVAHADSAKQARMARTVFRASRGDGISTMREIAPRAAKQSVSRVRGEPERGGWLRRRRAHA